MKNNLRNQRRLMIPDAAYDTIIETLEMDARSSAVDPELRKQIRSALDAIQDITPANHPEVITNGEEQLFEVRWLIDLSATTPEDAARQALTVQRNEDSIASNFQVRPKHGKNRSWQDVDVEEVQS